MPSFQLKERTQITSVQSFLADLDDAREAHKDLGHTWYFRGDKASTPLKPWIGRKLKYAGKVFTADKVTEEKFLNRFKRFAYPHVDRVQNDWEALFLARHYELPTRLLDWTTNPLIDLYFACSPSADTAPLGFLWGILRFTDETHDVDILDPTRKPLTLFPGDPCVVKLIYPVYNSSRIAAQKGLFSWHSHPHVALDCLADQEFDEDKLDIALLVKWPVPADSRISIVQDLERLGINQRAIFPDLIGTTKGIWQTMVLWEGK